MNAAQQCTFDVTSGDCACAVQQSNEMLTRAPSRWTPGAVKFGDRLAQDGVEPRPLCVPVVEGV